MTSLHTLVKNKLCEFWCECIRRAKHVERGSEKRSKAADVQSMSMMSTRMFHSDCENRTAEKL